MKSEIIYGKKTNPTSYVELVLKDDNKLDVVMRDKNNDVATVCHLSLKNEHCYETFKEALIQDLKEYMDDEDDVYTLIDSVQAQDYHDKWVDYADSAWDTEVLVSTDDIDKYMEEVVTRITLYYEKLGMLTDTTDETLSAIRKACWDYDIDPKKPLGDFREEYWYGVLATLNWITSNDEKHDYQVIG